MMRFLLALLLCFPVAAADTGWIIAGAGASVSDGFTAWTNPGNVTAADATNATCTPSVGDSTDFIKASSFATTIPVGATINGVEVKFKVSASASGHTEDVVKLVVGGSIVGASRATGDSITTTPRELTRGGASDLWSTSISRDQAVASNFGFVYQAVDNDSSTEQERMDAMWIKIYYTEATPATGGFPVTFLEVE